MRRIACLITILALAALHIAPARAQGNLPPHAWLFGAWTGGLFPPPSTLSAQECLAHAGGDLHPRYRDARGDHRPALRPAPGGDRAGHGGRSGVPLHPPVAAAPAGPFNLSPGGASNDVGFGCTSPDILRVQRHGENEISFPGCTDFPYPLVRCSAR